jgi:uridine kinase
MADKIQSTLGALVINVEEFIDGRNVIDGNYSDPVVFDFALLRRVLLDLKQNRSTSVPVVDPATKFRTDKVRQVDVPPSRVVVLEGDYALNSSIQDLLDLKIALNGGVHLDLCRRIVRDTISQTTTSKKEALFNITNVVFPMYKCFVEPDIARAQIRVYSNYNPVGSPGWLLLRCAFCPWGSPSFLCLCRSGECSALCSRILCVHLGEGVATLPSVL